MKVSLAMSRGRLRPAKRDDLDDLMALLHDPQVRRYLCDGAILPSETVAEMLSHSERLDPRGLGLWKIEQSRGDAIGFAGLQPASAEIATAPQMAGGIEPIIALSPPF